jgi:hypothetical protein
MIHDLLKFCCLTVLILLITTYTSIGQSTTSSSMTGKVVDDQGEPLPGAHVIATHLPSGTKYNSITRIDGRFDLQGMRIGGPYEVYVSFVGFEAQRFKDIQLRLGQKYELNITLSVGVELDVVEVNARTGSLISEDKSGASTNIGMEAIETMPTITRSIQDFSRMTPQSSGTSFAGQDQKAINFTVDGAILTDAFGISGSLPGAATNSNPITMEAIEEIQVNISPYDVTQGGFVGAGINAVTRSGDNTVKGSVFSNIRNQSMVGTRAIDSRVQTDNFSVNQTGFRIGAPIVKNKLFIFMAGELETRTDPATSFLANESGVSGGNVTRVERSDLEQVRSTLIDRFGYDPGRFQDFTLPTNSRKFFAKVDWNMNSDHTLSIRFNLMESLFARPPATTSFGFGGRHSNLFSMAFENSYYTLNDNFYSGIAELNSKFGNRYTNNFTVGYTAQRNFRSWEGGDFPAVDILRDGRNYISFGTDILSPNRALNSDIFQLQNNFKAYFKGHTVTAGVNIESFNFAYTFTPAYFGQYVFNSLDDFYDATNGQSVSLRRFQRSFSGLPGGGVPTAITRATTYSVYLQDELYAIERLKVTAGVRLDVPTYGNTAIQNEDVSQLVFRRPDGADFNINTGQLPAAQLMWSPRIGFNWDVTGDRKFQIRGGTGLFTGRPIYINISNMVNSNGLTLGQVRADNTSEFPFDPDVNAHIPSNAGQPDSYDLSYIDPNFRNPQVWRSNLGVEKVLFWGIIGSVEGIYTRQVNDLLFYESNLRPPTSTLNGPDNRPLYGFSDSANRINPNVTNATVMSNTDQGYAYNITFQLAKEFNKGFSAMVAYNYGVAKNIADGNTQHFLSYENIHSVAGGNFPTLGFSLDDRRHRFISSLSYGKAYKKDKYKTNVTMFFDWSNQGVFSYVLNGDANGDLVAGNDLMYVHTEDEIAQMNFEPLVLNGTTLSAEEQRALYNAYIQQDRHLRSRRGDYAQRHGSQLPMTGRLDFSVQQDINFNVKKRKNTVQLRVDIINLTNLINRNWGVGYTFLNDAPLTITSIDQNQNPTYQLNPVGNSIAQQSFARTATITDVWQMQIGARYIF